LLQKVRGHLIDMPSRPTRRLATWQHAQSDDRHKVLWVFTSYASKHVLLT